MTDQRHHQILSDLDPQHTALRERIPKVYKGFAQMSRAATIAGELDTMTKELIALAIGAVHGCDGCIATHARTAASAGASKQQAAARADTALCEPLDAENA
jgi:AhpD family alkylhydroperoxidase